MKQELRTLPEYPRVLVEFVLLDLSASVLNFSPFLFGHWISALLRYTVSDYPFSLWYIYIYTLFVNTRTHTYDCSLSN